MDEVDVLYLYMVNFHLFYHFKNVLYLGWLETRRYLVKDFKYTLVLFLT